MSKQEKSSLLARYYFFPLLLIGVGLILCSFVFESQKMLFSGMQQMGAGIGLIGMGEWMNHPVQKSLACDGGEKSPFHSFQHRKRIPSAFGNLMVILGLLLFFIGLADFI